MTASWSERKSCSLPGRKLDSCGSILTRRGRSKDMVGLEGLGPLLTGPTVSAPSTGCLASR